MNFLVAFEAHKGAVTQLYFEEENRMLITAGKDRAIRFWKLPERWTNEEIEKFEENEIKIMKDSMAMLKLQKTLTNQDEDSSDEDLNGWDYK